MNRIMGIVGLALCVVLATLLFGCEKTPQQESKMDGMKESMSAGADTMKEHASDAADSMSAGAGTMKEHASEAADSMSEGAGELKDSADQYIDDSAITANVKSKLMAEPVTKAYQISVETLNGTVQLSGFVQSAEEKSKAEEITKAVSGVKSVRNDLILKSKTSGMDDSRTIRRA